MKDPSTLAKGISQGPSDREINQFRGQFFGLLLAKYTLAASTLWTFLWGSSVVMLRLTWDIPSTQLLWGALGYIAALLYAFRKATHEQPPQQQVRAILDRYNEMGGLLMVQHEANIGAWTRHTKNIKRPHIAWRSGPAWGMFALALAFLTAGALIPTPVKSNTTKHTLMINDQVEQLGKQIKVLAQEQIINQQEAQRAKKQLSQIQKEASGREPTKTWQALDKMAQKHKQQAEKAAQKTLSEAEKWNQVQKMAEQLKRSLEKMAQQQSTSKKQNSSTSQPTSKQSAQKSQHQMSAAQRKALQKQMRKLAKMIQKALKANPSMAKHWPKSLLKSLKKMPSRTIKLSAKQLKMLMKMKMKKTTKSAKMCKKAGGGKLAKLFMAGMLSKSTLKTHARLGKGPFISRGPGHAALSWRHFTAKKGVKFKEKVLPKAQLNALTQSNLIKLSTGKHQKTNSSYVPSTGQLKHAHVDQNQAHTHKILPRYRGTIQRFFDKPKTP